MKFFFRRNRKRWTDDELSATARRLVQELNDGTACKDLEAWAQEAATVLHERLPPVTKLVYAHEMSCCPTCGKTWDGIPIPGTCPECGQ